MTLYHAIRSGEIKSTDWRAMNLHVVTSLGEIGEVVNVERNETRGYLMATLRHLNGEMFNQERAAICCTLLERR